MQREKSGIWLWLALVFMVGVVVGRFVVPLFEPKVVSYVGMPAEPSVKRCTLNMEHVTTVLGRVTSIVDETDSLKCSEGREFVGASIQCRCHPD